MDKVFTYESFVHAVAGATGGITAMTIFFPLDSVRTRLQVSDSSKSTGTFQALSDLIKEEGIEGLYQGLGAVLLSLGTSNFVYFYTYNSIKAVTKILQERSGSKPNISPIANLVIGSVAGVINVLITSPLWVVNTRIKTQAKKADTESEKPYTSVVDAFARIIREEGWQSLWKGTGSSLILVSNPSIQFATYENLRKILVRRAENRGYGITAFEFFVIGAIAKAVATILTYPLQIAQSKLRADRGQAIDQKQRKYNGTTDCLIQIYQKDGLKGWFRGMEAKLYQTVLTAAFQFLTYEQVFKLIFTLMGLKKRH